MKMSNDEIKEYFQSAFGLSVQSITPVVYYADDNDKIIDLTTEGSVFFGEAIISLVGNNATPPAYTMSTLSKNVDDSSMKFTDTFLTFPLASTFPLPIFCVMRRFEWTVSLATTSIFFQGYLVKYTA